MVRRRVPCFADRRSCRLVWNGLGDAGSGTDESLQVAFCEKLLVRGQDRDAGDSQFGGEISGGGDALSGTQLIGDDGLAKPVVELAVHRDFGFVVERNGWEETGGEALHGW